MTDAVAEPIEAESQEESTEDTAATPVDEEAATLKRRLAGKDQALTKAQKERDALSEKLEDVQKRLLEREQADMSEVDRLKAERDLAKAEAAAAREDATKARLARDFPLAVEFYGDDALPSEARLADLEKRLANKTDEETEDEPLIDPNRPRRASSAAPREKTAEDLERDLDRLAGAEPWRR